MTFLALRFQQLKDKLSVLDLFHDFIISDYYVAKSLIFSKNNLQDDEYQLFSRFFNIIFSDMPKPELLVYLYSDVERLQANIRKRGRSYEQEISDAYLENIQQGYFDFLRQQQNNMRILLLDTNDLDFVANEKDYQRIIEAINQPYEIGLHRISL
jgi:deoxyadenosine/deoxycytidine kinase